jgi:hypothetical protein
MRYLMALRSINLRIPEELLEAIDGAAATSHMDRSNWIRFQLSAAVGVSKDPELVDEIKVVDPRAREVIKDLISRVEKLEGHCFSDPFSTNSLG